MIFYRIPIHVALLVGAVGFTAAGRAGEAVPVPEAIRNARVIDSQVVDLGDRTITYNRIEAPVLKPQVKLAPVSADEAVEYVPTAAELAEMGRWESMRYEYLGGSATFFSGMGSELRIWTPEGEVVALSSIDFDFFRNLWDLERDGVYYSVFFCALEYSPEEFAEAKAVDPAWGAQLEVFPKEEGGISRFVVVSAPKGEAAENAIRAMEDLHAHFDENRNQLRAAYEESEKARLAQEEWDKAHPPVPQNTIVNFFPIRSSRCPAKTSVQTEAADR